MKLIYNQPALKDATIIDEEGLAVYTLDSSYRETLPGGDAKVDADSNGNFTITDTSATPVLIFSTVPVYKTGTVSDPIVDGADIVAFLQDPTRSHAIMGGNVTLESDVTVIGYKKILGFGTISTSPGTLFEVSGTSTLILGENVALSVNGATSGNNEGTIILSSGAELTDNGTGRGWAFANDAGGNIIVRDGSEAHAAGFDSTVFDFSDDSLVELSVDGARIVGSLLLESNFTVGAETISLQLDTSGVLTIDSGVQLIIADGGKLDVDFGFIAGTDDTSVIKVNENGEIEGQRAGLVAGVAGVDGATYTWDPDNSIWVLEGADSSTSTDGSNGGGGEGTNTEGTGTVNEGNEGTGTNDEGTGTGNEDPNGTGTVNEGTDDPPVEEQNNDPNEGQTEIIEEQNTDPEGTGTVNEGSDGPVEPPIEEQP